MTKLRQQQKSASYKNQPRQKSANENSANNKNQPATKISQDKNPPTKTPPKTKISQLQKSAKTKIRQDKFW